MLKSTFLGALAFGSYNPDVPNPIFSKLGQRREESQLKTCCECGISNFCGGHFSTPESPKWHNAQNSSFRWKVCGS